jgi:hypothetical protein
MCPHLQLWASRKGMQMGHPMRSREFCARYIDLSRLVCEDAAQGANTCQVLRSEAAGTSCAPAMPLLGKGYD